MPRWIPAMLLNRGRMPLLRAFLASVLICLSACSQDEPRETVAKSDSTPQAQQSAKIPARIPEDTFKVSARSIEKRCDNFKNGQRVRYKLTASEKIHVGVSFGKSLGGTNPVSVHLAKTEARTFTVKQTGEYCVHLDNRNSQPVQVALTVSARGDF